MSVSRLLLDQSNARLGEEQTNQQATQLALAQLLGPQLLEIAEDIVTNGLDPTALLAVTPDGAPRSKLRVIEGNRRLLALKVLDTPAIIDGVFSPARRKRLIALSEMFRADPISSVQCAVFEEEENARHWIELRHTGANDGVGLVEWDSNEQDRYRTRHGQPDERKPAGQIIDFVSHFYPAKPGDKRVFTTLERVVATRAVREDLGIEIDGGKVYSNFPVAEVLKGLSRLVADLRSGDIKVTDVYYEEDRLRYLTTFTAEELPDLATRLPIRQLLVSLAATQASGPNNGSPPPKQRTPEGEPQQGAGSNPTQPVVPSGVGNATGPGPGVGGFAGGPGVASSQPPPTGSGTLRPSRVRPLKQRTTTIPKSCVLYITDRRVNLMYHELCRLDVDQFSNACAVLLRVFVELSADSYIEKHNLVAEAERRSAKLKKKLMDVASHLKQDGKIDTQLQRAVEKFANSDGMFNSSIVTLHQYVHNPKAYPVPREIRTAWDEVQPFMTALWAK
ncbi:hypothetical protein AB0869_07070 [Micromonospora vinacea]|uniref:hypothetical protein n=1 Tax=Micromonospora vinacea TaxID=709878 RepID=UPI00345729A0